jgi:hypothetical protein
MYSISAILVSAANFDVRNPYTIRTINVKNNEFYKRKVVPVLN